MEKWEKMEEEVLEKYKVEEAKKGADQGRGEPLEWRTVNRVTRYQSRNEVNIAGREFIHG